MLKNFKLTMEYDGGGYHGWQRQKGTRTIQEEIEKALFIMTKKPVVVTGAGRTDAGTHALEQVANFRTDAALTAEIFQRGLNGLLPDDIVIKACEQVDPAFHARFDVASKTYGYRILNRRLPSAIGRQYVWFIPAVLHIDAMQRGVSYLIGSHDFKAFEGAGSPKSHTVRHVHHAELIEKGDGLLEFVIEANGFLRYMVRNMVGTLVCVGRGRRTPEDVREVLLSKNRNTAGPTAPACGLFLKKIRYEEMPEISP